MNPPSMWSSMPARMFSDEVLRVMTSMEQHSGEIIGKKKKDIMVGGHVFGKHLKDVKAAAKAAAKKSDDPNEKIEVDGVDLNGMKENEILKKYYVDYKKSCHHSSSGIAKQEEANKLNKLFKMFSKEELAQQTRFFSEMAYEQVIQERENEDAVDKGDENDDGDGRGLDVDMN